MEDCCDGNEKSKANELNEKTNNDHVFSQLNLARRLGIGENTPTSALYQKGEDIARDENLRENRRLDRAVVLAV